MSIIGKIFGGNGVVKEIGNVAKKFITTEADRLAFEAEMMALERKHQQELAETEAADRANARKREVDLNEGIGVWVQNVCAVLIVLGFLGLVFILITRPIEMTERQATMADIMLGNLAFMAGAVITYWFGSSAGSRMKDIVKRKTPDL